MRILHIITTMNPEAGGPIESVRMLLSYGPAGYSGEVVTLDDPEASFLKDLPYLVHPLGPQNGVYGFNPRLIPWLRANRKRFDGVVVNGLWQISGLAALLTIKGHLPYVVFTHGMLDPYFRRTFPLKNIKKWFYWIPVEYWVLRGALRVLFTCNEERDLAEKSFWLHRWVPYVVPYGTSGPQGEPSVTTARFHDRCPEMRGSRFLLYLGRIDRKKGCDLLIEAFTALATRDPDLHLVMAGPDKHNWREPLASIASRAGLAERIHWPGMLKGDAKWGALFACEAFILPSHQENFGIAVAEALSCGKPVLLSNKVNIAAQIECDGAGYMEPDTLAGTESLLRRWSDTSPPQRRAMCAQAMVTFATRYDMRGNANAIIRLFQDAQNETQPAATSAAAR